ncbi:MAG TPA: potassium channel family protein [Gammaproteobacteria bacterium]|nr:potassium channel family protein [Gammaproteobacteria bacterium]
MEKQHSPVPLLDALHSGAHWLIVASTVVLVIACVLLHYECFQLLSRFVAAAVPARRRRRILVVMLALLVTHIVEIWLFGVGYAVLLEHGALGSLAGIPVSGLLDAVYFSAVTYTTVGFGDITPLGPIRFMVGTEALTGLMLVTWSASLAFIEMQHHWGKG